MKNRWFVLLLFCALGISAEANLSTTYAMPPGPAGFSDSPSAILKVGGGCGWDYPCPPIPDYGRPPSYRSEQVYIHNNYGEVNIYVNGRRYSGPPPYSERRYWDTPQISYGVPYCGPTPCEQCGPGCWYRRFKDGYCGHGCDFYRERVGFDRGQKIIEYPRPYSYRLPPPEYYPRHDEGAYYRNDRHVEGPHRDGPPPVEAYPRKRFEGPQYPPPCANGAC